MKGHELLRRQYSTTPAPILPTTPAPILHPPAPILHQQSSMPEVMLGGVARWCSTSCSQAAMYGYSREAQDSTFSFSYLLSHLPLHHPGRVCRVLLITCAVYLATVGSSMGYGWGVKHSDWNSLQHHLHGNGPQGKGKGKGKAGKGYDDTTRKLTFEEQIAQALPQAAKLHMQPILVQEDWETQVVAWQTLGPKDGVAIVPKDALPEVLRNVGYSANKPTVAVLIQDPDELGIRGYPRTYISCRVRVTTEGGETADTTVQRYLVQLGFGEQASMKGIGMEIAVTKQMVPMTAKFFLRLGWQEGQILAAFLIEHVGTYVERESVEDVQSRCNGTVTFQCHAMCVDALLRASGKDGAFFKKRDCEPLEPLWLSDQTPLREALRLYGLPAALGLAEKGKMDG
ncbi:unnamed protein product [Prorocentrum cordatum]|nr:unnamed protein product [Polarella glacialis]